MGGGYSSDTCRLGMCCAGGVGHLRMRVFTKQGFYCTSWRVCTTHGAALATPDMRHETRFSTGSGRVAVSGRGLWLPTRAAVLVPAGIDLRAERTFVDPRGHANRQRKK